MNPTASDISAKKSETIRQMFGAISGRYDLANTVLSLGIHHLWRRTLVRWSGAKPGQRILDCASGTGDLAFEFERALGGQGEVIGTDFCEPMLQEAIKKAQTTKSTARFQVADVTQLPFETASFDIATISFGIRNVNDPARGLAELARVVKPGGVVLVLEFGQPRSAIFGSFYRFYSTKVLPRIGGIISGQPSAYSYLQKSSSEFPCGDAFIEMARTSGLIAFAEYRTLSGGIAYIYKLTRGEHQ